MTDTPRSTSALDRSVLVVAHPDDEILWFGSVAPYVDRIIVCFLHDPAHPDLSDARCHTLEQHPWAARMHCLALTETGAFGHADWTAPKVSPSGLELGGPRRIARVYRECAEDLQAELEPLLDGAANIFTHNPWGEYGHEEHVMVHRVATALARKAGAATWYDNYASSWSAALARRYLYDPDGAMFERPVDTVEMRRIADIYTAHGAWTWFDDYVWFTSECMVRASTPPAAGPRFGRSLPVNFLNLPDREARIRKPARLQAVRRFLRRIRQGGNRHD